MRARFGRLATGPIVVIGRAGMDLYADPPGARAEEATCFVAALGGSAANVAAGIVRLGGRAALVTCLSDDAVGRFCLNRLDAHGVDRSHVRLIADGVRTSLAVVETRLLDTQSVIYRNGAADLEMTAADVEAADWEAAGGLIATGTALAREPSRGAVMRALALGRAAGLPLILDVDYRPYTWSSDGEAGSVLLAAASLCDVVVGNDEEFGVLAGAPGDGLAVARALVARGATAAVHKMGERGAVTVTSDGESRTGTYPATPLKPTGAGDSFLAAFVMALGRGLDLRRAVLHGSAAAAIVVGRVGCAPAMPTRDEVEALMTAHPDPTRP